MGDIADMMIDGTLDIYTGEYIGEACGYPRTINEPNYFDKRNHKKVKCKICKRLISPQGIEQHNKAKHPELVKHLSEEK